ncbi:MAG: AEC family transporter [Desulfobulbaceae bacterium]|nr:AEC family transporter [Desulfobulbaceae bacterium]
MIPIANTIIPIFLIISLGWFLRSRRLVTAEILVPLNRLVYYLAIPAMIFRAVANASFAAFFSPALLAATLGPIMIVFFVALFCGLLFSMKRKLMGTFVQSSFHGNLGYIGFAVCYYLLGEDGLTRASILAGFMMLMQNFLAVLVLQFFSGNGDIHRTPWFFMKKILGNPVILSAVAGILFSVLEIPIGATIDRSLEILSNMALPLALLVIGSSISFDLIRANIGISFLTGVFKLLLLPAIGLAAYSFLAIPPEQFVPGVILLASPTATITYIMAGEMKGSTSLASSAISLNTLLSGVTFFFWLSLLV